MPVIAKKIFCEETEEELLKMTREEACLYLNDKQIQFCETYTRSYNVRLSAIKAGYSSKSAHIIGWKLRQRHDINRYIAWLKTRVSKKVNVSAMDVVDMYARIAFLDVTDFVTIKGNYVTLVNGTETDGQLIKSIKQGRDGIAIEFNDRLIALDKLERYFDIMPKDWKQKIEERKLELMKERVEIEKLKAGDFGKEIEDDGFMEALKQSVDTKEVWGMDNNDIIDY